MSPTERRSAACSVATCTATRWTVLNASATWPISSRERTEIGFISMVVASASPAPSPL
jgi:hypothetical protein